MLVKIKTWEELAKTCPTDPDGDFDCFYTFYSLAMETLLPPDRVISVCPVVQPLFLWEISPTQCYLISSNMIDEVLEP